MPTIVNPYRPDTSIGDMITKVADDLFGGDRLGAAVKREQFHGLQREAADKETKRQARERLATKFSTPGDVDVNGLVSEAIASGYDPSDAAELLRFRQANLFGAEDHRTTNAVVGAGGAYSSTATGFNADLSETRRNNDMASSDRRYSTDTAAAENRRQFDREPTQVLRDGKPAFLPQSDVFSPGVEPIVEPSKRGPAYEFNQFYDLHRQRFPKATLQEAEAYALDQTSKRNGPSTVINNIPGEGAFDKKIAENQAELFSAMAADSVQAKADRAMLEQFDARAQDVPGGIYGRLRQFGARLGVDTSKMASDIEAADAIVARLVPAARQGLPGAASDRDVALFKSSLPNLSQSPVGRALISETLKALADYRIKQGEIATAVTTEKMGRADAMQALHDLPSPFSAFNEHGKHLAELPPAAAPVPQQASAPVKVSSPEEARRLPSGTKFITPDGREMRVP